jgi:hypothetical protein
MVASSAMAGCRRAALPGLLAVGLACGREAPAPSPAAAHASPPAPADAARQVVLRSVALGKSINPDGSVAAPAGVFTAGEPLFVSLDVRPLAPGTEVRIAWRGPASEDNGEEEIVVPTGARIVSFKARDVAGWKPGEHHLEVWLGGAAAGSRKFRIVSGAHPADTSTGPR